MDAYGTARLAAKEAESAIVVRICEDFNLTPVLARAHYEQMARYFADYGHVATEPGELCYLAVDANEPSGKPILACRKVQVRLELAAGEDHAVLRENGLAAMRQQRLARLARQAQVQGGLLTVEDLAYLTCSSPATVKRDLAACRRRDVAVPTRGQIKDIGPGLSHKAQVVQLYLWGLQFTDIESRTRHSEASIKRYLADFRQIVALYARGAKIPEIRAATGRSAALIAEYMVRNYYTRPGDLEAGQFIYHAPAATERSGRAKTIGGTKLILVRLAIVADEDVDAIRAHLPAAKRREIRVRRLTHEAYEQGGVLSCADIGILTGYSTSAVSMTAVALRHQGELLPLRGYVVDMGSYPTHKAIIVRLYLQGLTTPEIATRTYHTKESVDRYLRGFERVRLLAAKHAREELPLLTGMAPRVVDQYLALLEEHVAATSTDRRYRRVSS